MNDMPRRLSTPGHGGPDRAASCNGSHRAGPFGVLDIGTTKIACLIGRTESDGSLRVLGFGWQKGRGMFAPAASSISTRRSAAYAPRWVRRRTWPTRGCAR